MKLSDFEIARAYEEKGAFATRLGALVAEEIAGGCMVFDGPGSYVNRACGLGLDGAVPADEIERLVTFFVSRRVEPRVIVSEYAHPSLRRQLEARGFHLADTEILFARDLDDADPASAFAPEGLAPGIVLERVDPSDPAAVRASVEVNLRGFHPDAAVPESWVRVGERRMQEPSFDAYVARVGGELVGAAALESSHGLASLLGTSVLPTHRRLGIQQAFMAKRLWRGRALGVSVATVGSSPDGPTARNAARFGFRPVFTRFVLVLSGEGLAPILG